MAVSLLGLGVCLGGSTALAQQPGSAGRGWEVVPIDPPSRPMPALNNLPMPAPPLANGMNWQTAVPGKAIGTVPPVQQAALQPLQRLPRQPESVKAPTEDTTEVQIQLEPPGPEKLFLRQSEVSLHERMRQEARGRRPLDRLQFPDEPVLSTERFVARAFPPSVALVEPNYVNYERLYFEDINSERYGWDFGFIQPFVSAGKFYADLITLPYHIGTAPCRKFDSSAGFCLPGDPVPYLIYPIDLSVTGTALETGTIAGLFAIFPG